jgi:hypothetical protein
MAKCDKCLYGDVCFTVLDTSECKNFKDRSQFVELPCSAGDTVYYIANVNGKDTISSAVVDEVAIYKSGTIGYDCGVGEIGFSSKSIGKRVFLTKEEAEQALKEREKND